jgi:predicted nucleic acid-binding protein
MTVYIDTSVVLRRLLRQPDPIADWGSWDAAYTSVLCRTEFSRTLDRLRLEGSITDDQRAAVQQQFERFWSSVHGIRLEEEVLLRAEHSFSTIIGTLDAIHLASALVVQARGLATLQLLLTHDEQLGRAARAVGFAVGGV